MEAYWFTQDDATITVGKPNRDPLLHKDHNRIGHSPIPDHMREYYPTEAWVRARRRIPTTWMIAFGYCVTQDVKAIIEELEPEIHQFIPITVKCGSKSDYTTYDYFSLRINQQIDDVLVEKSDVKWKTMEANGKVLRSWLKKEAPLVLPRKSIESKHLWWNGQSTGLMMMSGELYQSLTNARLTQGLRFQQQIVE